MQQEQNPAVRKTIVVNAEPEHAFAVFTKNMGQWWPKEHHIGGSPIVAVIVEPRAGGRCIGHTMGGVFGADAAPTPEEAAVIGAMKFHRFEMMGRSVD